MRVIIVGSDRSKRGSLSHGSVAEFRQEAYAEALGHIDDISFTLASDRIEGYEKEPRSIFPTNSSNKWLYILDALSIAKTLDKPDVVSAQDPFEAGLAGYLMARHFGVPLHIQIHTDFLDPAYAKHSLLNRIRVQISRFVLPRASGIRVVSERINVSVKKNFPKLKVNPTVLPIFVDVDRIKALPPSEAMRAKFERFTWKLLVVSRLESEKRVLLSLDALSRADRSDTCLIIVGDGSERSFLERKARELGVEHQVFFEGGQEAAPYYHIADLVLVTSEYEGYGQVIVEALSMGKPVLSTDVGVAREAGVTQIAPASLYSEALRKWLHDGARTGELALHTYKDFDAYVQAYVESIRSCLRHE